MEVSTQGVDYGRTPLMHEDLGRGIMILKIPPHNVWTGNFSAWAYQPTQYVLVRNDKGSHNPDESMDLPDFFAAAEVVARTVWQAANSTQDFRT